LNICPCVKKIAAAADQCFGDFNLANQGKLQEG